MIHISQKVLLLGVLCIFTLISSLFLIRAEKLVIPEQFSLEVSGNNTFPGTFTYVDRISEIEEVVGDEIAAMTYIPKEYELYGVAYKLGNEELSIRQTFINHNEGRVIYEQQSYEGPINYQAEGYDHSKKWFYSSKQLNFLYKNGEVYKVTWIDDNLLYSISSLQPFSIDEWKQMIRGVNY